MNDGKISQFCLKSKLENDGGKGDGKAKSLDEACRQLGSQLLYDALSELKELKDSPELSVYQRAQMNLAIARLIAGAK